MDSKDREQQLAEYLFAKPSWLRKVLQLDYALTTEELADMASVNWPVVYGEARDEYLGLLERCPDKLSDYRKRLKTQGSKSALVGVPGMPLGAPRKEWLAQLCRELQERGMSQPEIAREVNLRYPDLKDKKGNLRPITEEVVRKRLSSGRKRTPEKT
jgi:hypothetical protein